MSTIDQGFMDVLKQKYKMMRRGEDAWAEEKENVQAILSEVESDIQNRYKVDSPINIGGTAIILKVIDTNLDIPYALKCARPLAGKEIWLSEIISGEIKHLRESSHPNIVSIFHKGEVQVNQGKWPYYIMEYIDGAQDALEYISENLPACIILTSIIRQCLAGLDYLHKHGTAHLDIKLENILVSPDMRAKITDLGSARVIHAEDERQTKITFTSDFAHPELRGFRSEYSTTDRNRVRATIPRSTLRTQFDLYALGQNIRRILRMYDPSDEQNIPTYHRHYLDLMACRMLDGQNSHEECALGLPRNAFQEIKYSLAEEALTDIDKLTVAYRIQERVPELDIYYPRTIQISSPSPSSFSDRVARMLSSPLIRRLAGVSQLGLIVQIYPTATHSRLEHLLGTFANTARYCNALWNDSVNPLFRQIMSEKDINLLLISALCHDIGHYPLAHDLDEAEPKTFSHAKMARKILTDPISKDCASLRKTLEEDWGITPEEIVDLLTTDPTDLDKPLKIRLLHTIIDGPLDADKTDYLIRDSNNLNVPYGKGIDLEKLLKCLTVVFAERVGKTFITLGIHEKGKVPAESLTFARYAMFGSVYWHHTSRSVKTMLHRAVWEALPETDKRTREFKVFQEELFQEIMGQLHTGEKAAIQENLFAGEEGTRLTRTPQMALSDYRILAWLYEKCTESGKQLLEMICERHLFKRLLVVSHRKSPRVWDRLTDLRKNYSWHERLKFQCLLQESLVRLLDSIEDDVRKTTSILSRDVTDDIVSRAYRGEVLFLVDMPDERRGSSFDLYFLPESRTTGPLQLSEDTVQMEDSIIWTNLSKNFLKSVGKVRVFCHPDIIETCLASMKRPDIEGALETACLQVTG